MNASEDLQRALYAHITGTPAIMALVGGVYDHVPTAPFGDKAAYISWGPSDTVEDDSECVTGVEITFQIDVWSKSPGTVECKRITDLVRRAVHEQDITLADNALAFTHVALTRIIPDPGGYHHGVVQVTCAVEEA